jgi:nucleoside phosphorylase
VGCAGALDPALDTGAGLLVRRVIRDGVVSGVVGGDGALELGPGPAALAGLREGTSVTVGAIVSRPADKAALRTRTGGDVAEMETFEAVRAARAAGLEVTCLRVVVDRADEQLPDLTAGLDEVGRPRPLALARTLLRRPGATARLPRLAKAFGQAQAELTRLVLLVAGA